MASHHHHRRPLRQPLAHGFTLLEVLVAIIILSLGVLGAAGMQFGALKSNKEARYQSVAAAFGRELAEKMRGNHRVAIETTAAKNPYLVDAKLAPDTAVTAATSNCFTAACADTLAVAQWEIADWQTRLRDALPSPRAVVCFDSDPYDSAGKPRWTCTNTGDVSVLKLSWTRSDDSAGLVFSPTPFVVVPLTAGSPE